jgi:hypothetical protein
MTSTHETWGSISRQHRNAGDPLPRSRRAGGPAPSRCPGPTCDPRRSCRAALTALSCSLGILAVIAPVAARAGTYTIGDCPSASDHTTLAGPWQVFGQTPSTILETGCSSSVAALYFANAELPSTAIGFRASTAGTQLSIVAARIWWRAFGSPSGAVEANTEASNDTGEGLAFGQADGSGELFAQMTTPEEFHFPASDHASTITLSEHCLEYDTCPMTESFGVGIEIFGAELTLNDEVPPTVSVTGVQNEGQGTFTGPIATTFTASDPDAGVETAELLLDGVPIATHSYASSCSYTRLQPCPATISDRFGGISLPEGGHELAVRITDAAGNTAIAPVPHMANGVPCPGPTLALTADGKPAEVTIPYGQAVTIEGRLACGLTPVPGATVSLGTAALVDVPLAAGPVLTGPDGTFSYQLPPGPSRELVFGYRAYSNESAPTTQATVQIDVRPRMTLRISPRRTYNHGTIRWSGRVEGGPYPADGMPVLVQVKEGRRWQTFEELKVHNGVIAYDYTFLRTHNPTAYTFRIALPSNGDVGYPYAANASPGVSVYVAPHAPRSRAHKRRRRSRPHARNRRRSG